MLVLYRLDDILQSCWDKRDYGWEIRGRQAAFKPFCGTFIQSPLATMFHEIIYEINMSFLGCSYPITLFLQRINCVWTGKHLKKGYEIFAIFRTKIPARDSRNFWDWVFWDFFDVVVKTKVAIYANFLHNCRKYMKKTQFCLIIHYQLVLTEKY
jgi:hypothetical protein